MAWWGKIVGGAFGYLVGGPLGAMLGGVLGHQFDEGLKKIGYEGVRPEPGDQERVQTAFFTATFSVMGYVAKADGLVSREEIRVANHIMGQMRLDDDQRRAARELFGKGKEPGFPIDDVLEQFRRECHRRISLIRMFLEVQIQAALADGALHGEEREALLDIAQKLGFPRAQFRQLLDMMSATLGAGAYDQRAGPARQSSLASDYKLLGIPRTASDGELKKAYRRLMNQHHPDKLVAKGLPEEMTKIATEKTQQIKAAYERIKKARTVAHA